MEEHHDAEESTTPELQERPTSFDLNFSWEDGQEDWTSLPPTTPGPPQTLLSSKESLSQRFSAILSPKSNLPRHHQNSSWFWKSRRTKKKSLLGLLGVVLSILLLAAVIIYRGASPSRGSVATQTGQDDEAGAFAPTGHAGPLDDPLEDDIAPDRIISPGDSEDSISQDDDETEKPNAPANAEPTEEPEIESPLEASSSQKEKSKGPPKKPQKVAPKGLWSNLRLPEWAVPYHYDVTIDTQLDAFTFRGHVDIHLELRKSSSFVVFHAAMLSVNKVYIKNSNSQSLTIKNLEEHTDKEFWVASTQQEMGEFY